MTWDVHTRERLSDAIAREARYLAGERVREEDMKHLRQLAWDIVFLPLGTILSEDLSECGDGRNAVERVSVALDYYGIEV